MTTYFLAGVSRADDTLWGDGEILLRVGGQGDAQDG